MFMHCTAHIVTLTWCLHAAPVTARVAAHGCGYKCPAALLTDPALPCWRAPCLPVLKPHNVLLTESGIAKIGEWQSDGTAGDEAC